MSIYGFGEPCESMWGFSLGPIVMPDKQPKMWLHKASGYYCVKHQGTRHYLSKDPEKAKKEYDQLMATLDVREQVAGRDVTLHTLVNSFYEFQCGRAEAGELKPATLSSIHGSCARCLKFFKRDAKVGNLTPARFTKFRSWLNKNYTVTTVQVTVKELRAALAFGTRNRLICEMPEMGECRPPSARLLRRHKRERGKGRVLSQKDVVALLAVCRPLDRAFVLLGVNCGLGPADIAALEWGHLNGHWLDYDRIKTGERRVGWLWNETINALPERGEHELVFPDKWGVQRSADAVRMRIFAAMKRAELHHSAYDLRHTLATIGAQNGDPDALRAIMGHVDTTLLADYVHDTAKERIRAVSQCVHDWAFDVPADVTETPAFRIVG